MEIPPTTEQSPVFLWAPTARCGITLLQRLISSSKDMLVFGENRMLTGHLPAAVAKVQEPPETRDASRKRMAAGDFEFWSSDVHPLTIAERQWSDSSFQMLASVYQYSATTEGFARWGIKEPMMDSTVLAVMRGYFPKANNVFIYRDLHDVLKSYKARGWLESAARVQEVAGRWADATAMLLEFRRANAAITIKYEELMADREKHCKLLEESLNISPIDRKVFDARVNTFERSKEAGHNQDQYVAPKALTDEEKRVALQRASQVLSAAGYSTDW